MYLSLFVPTNLMMIIPVINPRRMREGYGSHSVCICLSVTMLTATYGNVPCL